MQTGDRNQDRSLHHRIYVQMAVPLAEIARSVLINTYYEVDNATEEVMYMDNDFLTEYK